MNVESCQKDAAMLQRLRRFPLFLGFACVLLTWQIAGVAISPVYAACPTFPYSVPAGDVADLINAMTCANATPANDVINLTNSIYTLTTVNINATGLPKIPSTVTGGTLTIHGNGATITRSTAAGTPDLRLFYVDNGANLTLNNLLLTDGKLSASLAGGGIFNLGNLTLSHSTLSRSSSAGGGGVFNSGGTVTLSHSTLSANVATYGSAIVTFGGTVRIMNSTISGNNATGNNTDLDGGAVNISGASATVMITNSTITANTAVFSARSGLFLEGGTLTIQNSIVANNEGVNNCAVMGGTFTDNGNNLDNGTTCDFGGAVGQNTNPLLGTLANNGGATLTHALLTGSPAINAGSNAKAVDQNGVALTTDQRGAGFTRFINSIVDIGAYEAALGAETLNVQLTLQGRTMPAPHPSRMVTVNVQIQPQGGGAVFYNQNFTTDASSTFSIPNLPTGTHLFTFKGNHTLARQATLTIVTDVNTTTTATLLEGDANGNNLVNIIDFSLLATAFGKATGQQGFNALTDFSNDGLVNILDFSLLASNFNMTGDGGVIP